MEGINCEASQESGIFQSLTMIFFAERQSQKGRASHNGPLK